MVNVGKYTIPKNESTTSVQFQPGAAEQDLPGPKRKNKTWIGSRQGSKSPMRGHMMFFFESEFHGGILPGIDFHQTAIGSFSIVLPRFRQVVM